MITLAPLKLGRLTRFALEGINSHREAQWIYYCLCGNFTKITNSNLKCTSSCGCLRRERGVIFGAKSKKHGDWNTIEYHTWEGMLQRCYNPNATNYQYWGGRGITVCKSWHQYQNFLNDMGRRPGKGYSLDRCNNNGNYEPNNCRWVTWHEQAVNHRKHGQVI